MNLRENAQCSVSEYAQVNQADETQRSVIQAISD